jgi:hypothetical protein
VGSFASRALHIVVAGLIRDSADELRCLDWDFESTEVVEGRRVEFALTCCSGNDAWPSRPGLNASSWSRAESLEQVFGRFNESVVDSAAGSAEGARSRARCC